MERAQRTEVEDLVSVLTRLGLTALGDFTALPTADVVARFGHVGAWAQRMAAARTWPLPCCAAPRQTSASSTCSRIPPKGSSNSPWWPLTWPNNSTPRCWLPPSRCSRVRIGARTVAGDELVRVWRTDVGTRSGAFAKHMADRVRWQLEGWLSGTSSGPQPAPLTALTLTAEDVVPLGSEQSYLWGGTSGADARAHRALERVQGLLGAEGVLAVAEQGGRTPRDRVHALAWGQEGEPPRRVSHPWPGRIPDPAPATVLPVPLEIHVLDAGGSPVRVDRRLAVSAPPTWVRLQADPRDKVARAAHRHPSSGHVGGDDGPVWAAPMPVEAWAGPWPMVERWWSGEASRRAFLQVAIRDDASDTDAALLVALHERALDAGGRL